MKFISKNSNNYECALENYFSTFAQEMPGEMGSWNSKQVEDKERVMTDKRKG